MYHCIFTMRRPMLSTIGDSRRPKLTPTIPTIKKPLHKTSAQRNPRPNFPTPHMPIFSKIQNTKMWSDSHPGILEAWDTGNYSDLKVTCGSDVYNLHKPIVCQAS